MDRELTPASNDIDRPARGTAIPGPGGLFACGARREAGFSLMEALVAMAIAVLAVVGLAYSFGVGRGWINRFEVARVADARAQARLDSLLSLPNTDPVMILGTHTGPPFTYQGQTLGAESWRIETVANAVPGHSVLRRATTTVSWQLATITDSLSYQALFPAP